MSVYAIKFLKDDGRAPIMRGFKYELPVNGEPSKWYSKKKKRIYCCGEGYHAATKDELDSNYRGYYRRRSKCFVVEVYGKIDYSYSKVSCENMRIIEEIPLKPLKEVGGDIVATYERDNVREILRFCREKGYELIGEDFISKMTRDRFGYYRVEK